MLINDHSRVDENEEPEKDLSVELTPEELEALAKVLTEDIDNQRRVAKKQSEQGPD
jgi:hypothetical protein